MTQNWISIVEFNWIFSKLYLHTHTKKLVYNPCIYTVQLKKVTITHIYGFKLYSLSLSLSLLLFLFIEFLMIYLY